MRASRRGTARPIPAGRSASSTSFTPLNRTAPNTIGIRSRNENRAAASRSSPENRPAVIVTPERDTPGISARICDSPISVARPSPVSEMPARCGVRSAIQSRIPKVASRIAICHGSPSLVSIQSSPAAPTTAAGIVASPIAHAIRSSASRIERAATERKNAAV